jgi:hypothetical protein
VLEEPLGRACRGIITSDFFGAYRKFCRVSGAAIQFCWAHLIREVLFLEKLRDQAVVRYGKRILKQIRLMFETIRVKGTMGEGADGAAPGTDSKTGHRYGAGTKGSETDSETAEGMGTGIL